MQMKVKFVVDEDFVNYYKPSMFIGFPNCSFKCDKENGNRICQNGRLAHEPNIEIDPEELVDRFIFNQISKAIVFGGLEPLDSYEDMLELIKAFRTYTDADIVIYTGYTEKELTDRIDEITQYGNIVIKYGRFIPGQQPHKDKVLGVKLASSNQYAKRYD